MLVDPPADDWLMWSRTYGHWGHSPLDQITTTNVGGLRLAWAWTMRDSRQETTPLLHDGMMLPRHPSRRAVSTTPVDSPTRTVAVRRTHRPSPRLLDDVSV